MIQHVPPAVDWNLVCFYSMSRTWRTSQPAIRVLGCYFQTSTKNTHPPYQNISTDMFKLF